MTTRLTLSVEKQVVQKAKRFAKSQRRSLSETVTSYLDYISTESVGPQEIDREVLRAAGQIRPERLLEVKEPKYFCLKQKYLHG